MYKLYKFLVKKGVLISKNGKKGMHKGLYTKLKNPYTFYTALYIFYISSLFPN
jgi:hypothetical protein